MLVGTSHGDIDELRFSAFAHQRLREDAAEGDSALISYYGEPDRDSRGVMNLMRRETRRLQAVDPKQIPGEAYILCPDVARVKYSFYDFKKKEWREDWSTLGADGQQYLPTVVRITLTVVDERGIAVPYSTAARIHITEKVSYRDQRS